MRIPSLLFFYPLLLILGGCSTTHPPAASAFNSTTAESTVRAASADWDRLFNSGDAAKLADLYAEDAVSMPPGLPILTGRKALQADFLEFFAANTARHQTAIDQLIIDGDLAIERAHYKLTIKHRTGGSETTETGRHVEIRRNLRGQWKIVTEIWNTDPAPK